MNHLKLLNSYEVLFVAGGSDDECRDGCCESYCSCSELNPDTTGVKAGISAVVVGAIGVIMSILFCSIERSIQRHNRQ